MRVVVKRGKDLLKRATLVFLATALLIGVATTAFLSAPSAKADPPTPWHPTSISSLTAGQQNTCAIADGQSYCWGYSETKDPAPVFPTQNVPGETEGQMMQSIDAGQYGFQCGVVSNAKAYCIGAGYNGALGIGSTSYSTDGAVYVDDSGVLSGKTVTSVTAGSGYACALADGGLYCWGKGNYGQLGNGTTDESYVPVAVDTTGVLAGKTITQIEAMNSQVCAIASGKAYCWGRNNVSQLGDGTTTNRLVPVAVNASGALSGKTVSKLAGSQNNTCAVTTTSEVYCWGQNHSVSPTQVDTSILGGATIQSIASGLYHFCVLASDGKAYCWGANTDGQLGDGLTTVTYSVTPVAVSTSGSLSGKTLSMITAGGNHTCAASTDSYLYCWGNNNDGELGDGQGGMGLFSTEVVRVGEASIYHATNISGVSFDTVSGKKIMTVTGTHFPFVYDANARSLVKLNGATLAFCTFAGIDAATFVSDFGILARLVTDDPPCYITSDDMGSPLMTSTEVKVWLPSGFDMAGTGTIKVNDSSVFTFNPSGTPAPDPDPTPTPESTTSGTGGQSTSNNNTPNGTTQTTETATKEDSFQVDDKSFGDTPSVSQRPTFSGTADPFSTVTVTVHSDPVTCTTTADATGHWSCTLDKDLPSGAHSVFVKVVTTDNVTKEYGPYDVIVKEDTAPIEITSDTKTESLGAETSSAPWLWIALAAGAFVLVVIIAIVARRRSA